MDDSTFAKLGLFSSIFGAFSSAFGASRKSEATKQYYEYKAGVARNNAALAEYQAQDALNRGAAEVSRSRLKYAAVKGSQRARLAAMGVDVNEGSARNIQDDTQFISDSDAMTIQDNALRAAWGFRVDAANKTADAQMYSSAADAESPLLSGVTALLGSGMTVADSWYRYSRRQPAALDTGPYYDP